MTQDNPDRTAVIVKPDQEVTVPQTRFLGLSRGDQIFVAVLLAVLAALSIGYGVKTSGWGRKSVEIERLPSRKYDFRLDVNRAGWVQWAQLEGIGEVLARRIVEDRKLNGPFHSTDDLRRVNGIGEKKLAAIREWLCVAEAGVQAEE